MKTFFREIKINGEKSGKCSVCGKKATRSEVFFQTLNPWNKLLSGELKAKEDIFEELKVEKEAWLNLPVIHKKCEK